MSAQHNNNLSFKIFLLGGLIATLVYIFHPAIGQLSLSINGEPVADPLVHFAAIPTLLIAILFVGVLMFLVLLGVGMFIFMAALMFVLLAVFMIAPYFWPILVIIFLVVALMSVGNSINNS